MAGTQDQARHSRNHGNLRKYDGKKPVAGCDLSVGRADVSCTQTEYQCQLRVISNFVESKPILITLQNYNTIHNS